MEIEAKTHTLRDGGSLTIRSAIADDAPATLELLRSVVEEGAYTVREPSEFDLTEAGERECIEEDREAAGNLCLVATTGGEVVGMVRASAETYRRTRHFADLDSLWVHAVHRRRGVAGTLLAALVAWARSHPEIEKLGLYVFSTNGGAVRLYETHGFAVEGRYPRDIKFGDGSYADTVAMGLIVKERPAGSNA
ncbi:GNAT family N-acetyltransferase [Rubrobacter tropicus]|uniref:GNAT family N-acetyltransferase n=1 Tax=Rubrobacter tropicus TaxID=2653851 RepID=A0A6G8QBL6_9ACTN|nr:GNAT family N-acetyltransferase [Rubrobacter tropicus]QIN83894.1 GNAT family N-acetyltransferase [Rubrobacter tropicus]